MNYAEMNEKEQEAFFDSIKEDKSEGSMAAWIEAINIFSKYAKKGLHEKYFCGGEHDAIYFYFSTETIEPTSEDGKRLLALGFFPDCDSGNWMKFT